MTDIAPVKEIIEVSKKYNAITYIDEVHAVKRLYVKQKVFVKETKLKLTFINGTLLKQVPSGITGKRESL